MFDCFACIYVCSSHVQSLAQARGAMNSLELELRRDWELHCECWELNCDPLESSRAGALNPSFQLLNLRLVFVIAVVFVFNL